MKKKVCHLTSVHTRYDMRIFQKICTSLASSEYEVYLVVADGKGDEIKNNINIVDIGYEPKRFKRILFVPKKIFRKAVELDCEIYHFHDPELFPIALKLKKIGNKLIFDSHEYLPGQIMDKEYLPKILRKFISLLVKTYYDINIKKLDAVFSVTPHIVEDLSVNSENVFLLTNYPIVNGISEKFSKEEYILRKDTIFYAGTIYTTSQQDLIIRAMERIDSVEYSLVGNIEDKYKLYLSKLPSWKKVDLISYVPKFKLDEIANNVTIGLAIFDYIPNLGYKKGSLGVNKIFEYMLYGLPIVCTDFELWKEIVDKYKCGICVKSNSIDEIEKAIKYLINNKEEAYQMGKNGRTAVLKEFNWTTQEKKLQSVYDSLKY